jgi:hypothetical protein
MRLVSEEAADKLGGYVRPPHIEVASDREAMRMALQEFMVREMFENGAAQGLLSGHQLFTLAQSNALVEFLEAPINKPKGGNCV